MKKNIGFTLIEILIVVAIIAILSAIAVPNFLEAQTRSKVSRVRADMYSIAMALETYCVDHNHYPPMCESYHGIRWCDCPGEYTMGIHDRVPDFITTPIAYLTKVPLDVFNCPVLGLCVYDYEQYSKFQMRYKYVNTSVCDEWDTKKAFENSMYKEIAGKWLLYSSGPDEGILGTARDFDNPDRLDGVNINYNPTNGCISRGNIFRTFNDPEKIQMLSDEEWLNLIE